MLGAEIERLIEVLSRLPGLGPRSGRRIALRLLTEKETRLRPLMDALQAASSRVVTCTVCGALDTTNPCAICADPAREPLICVVESVADLWALERAGVYRGRYHVLGGTISALGGRGPEALNLASLYPRLGTATEVILALPATVEGAATGHYLTDKLKDSGVAVTRLAQGVPMGGAIEILDEGTLATALASRRAV